MYVAITGHTHPKLDLNHVHSVPSTWNIAKLACLSLCFAALSRDRKSPALVCLSVLFATLALDDYGEYHERAGLAVSTMLAITLIFAFTLRVAVLGLYR